MAAVGDFSHCLSLPRGLASELSGYPDKAVTAVTGRASPIRSIGAIQRLSTPSTGAERYPHAVRANPHDASFGISKNQAAGK